MMDRIEGHRIYLELSDLIADNAKVIDTSVGEFEITPLKLPTVLKIIGHLESFKLDQQDSLERINIDVMLNHYDTLINILIAVLHNKQGNPPKELIEKVYDLNVSDVFKLTEDIDYNAFLSRITDTFKKNIKEGEKGKKSKFNPLEFINGCLKYFRYRYDELIWKIPFSVLIGINLFTPSYDGKEEDVVEKKEVTGADLFERFKKK